MKVLSWHINPDAEKMASSFEANKVLEAAMTAIPRIAEAVAAIPPENRETALDAAARRYLQTAYDLGGGEAAARAWATTVMRHLLSHVAEQDLERQKMLKGLLRELELVQAESGTN
jgi:hypothetical protein